MVSKKKPDHLAQLATLLIALTALVGCSIPVTPFTNCDPPTKLSCANSNLVGKVLSGADLSDADLSGADLTSADLSGADLTSANLASANLTDANLSGADMYGVNLLRANLAGVNWYRANLKGTALSNMQISESGTILKVNGYEVYPGANLDEVNFRGVNLSGKYLRLVSLNRSNLSKADLSGADLTDANLSYANLTGADLTNANLTGADLYGAILKDTNLTGSWRKGLKRVPEITTTTSTTTTSTTVVSGSVNTSNAAPIIGVPSGGYDSSRKATSIFCQEGTTWHFCTVYYDDGTNSRPRVVVNKKVVTTYRYWGWGKWTCLQLYENGGIKEIFC